MMVWLVVRRISRNFLNDICLKNVSRILVGLSDRKKIEILFELCTTCISILQTRRNRLHRTVFQNSTENAFSSFFRFCSIYSHMRAIIEISSKKRITLRISVEFRKTVWRNRFLRAWRMLIHNSEKEIE